MAVMITWVVLAAIWYSGAVTPVSTTTAQSSHSSDFDDQPQASPAATRPAPDFTLTDLDGNRVSLSQFRGKPVVINFWATWCPPCKAELPHLVKAYEREQGRVVFLAISVDEPERTVRRFVEDNGVSLTVLLDDGGEVAADYRVEGIPTTFFISRDGEIVARYVGQIPSHRIEDGVRRIR
jgi:peroxiredoxin